MPAKQKTAKSEKTTGSGRVRKLDYKSKKKVVRTSEPIAGSFKILRMSIRHLWLNKRLFGGILLVYLVLFALLVKGLATNFQLAETRNQIEEAVDGDLGNIEMGAVLFGTLIGTASRAPSESSAVYQTLLFVVMSLAVIWALRQTFEAPKSIKMKQAFYSGMAPFVTYLLVCLVILLQLLPALIGSFIYSIVVNNSIAVGWIEQVMWLVFLVAALGVSVFFVSSSLFATYIVTLPGIEPLQALRKSRSLVKFRRFLIIRKVLFLPVVLLMFMLLIFFPLVIYAAVAAEVLFMIFSLALLILAHTYLYILYREML